MQCRHQRKRRARRTATWTRERSALANAAKARRRLAAPAPDREPKMLPFYRYDFRIRDRINGDVSDWLTLRSVRDLSRRVAVLLREAP